MTAEVPEAVPRLVLRKKHYVPAEPGESAVIKGAARAGFGVWAGGPLGG